MASLSYTECEIDTGTLQSQAETFQELHAKISGRSGEFSTITEPVATHFEGLVGEGLKSVAAENQEAWSSAMMACYHAYGMVQKVITDVEWYENRIEEIKADLATALGSSPSTGDETENASLRNAIVVSHNEMATEAWEKLETRCEATEERLREGPTPDNIKELIEAGHLGENIAYYTTSDVDYFYFDGSAGENVAWAIKNAALNGGLENEEFLEEQLSIIAAMVALAARKQEDGEQLTEEELAFLEALNGELDIAGSESTFTRTEEIDGEYLSTIRSINESDWLTGDQKERISELLGGALLASTNEEIGGSYESLPESLQDVVEGPMPSDFNGTNDDSQGLAEWTADVETLAELLGSTGDGVQGGVEFSATVTTTFGHVIGQAGESLELSAAVETSEVSIGQLLEVAMRNEDANYTVLVGETPGPGSDVFEHPIYGEVGLDEIINSLYTYEWEDGGKSITGLTDWIVDYEMSGDTTEDRMATRAAFELISTMTDEPLRTQLQGTGNEVNGNVDAAFTEYNNYLAASLNNVYIVNIDDFAMFPDPQGGSVEDRWGLMSVDDLDRNPLHENDDIALFLSQDTKRDFLQILLANDELAPNILAATSSYETELIGFALTGSGDWQYELDGIEGDTGSEAKDLGQRAGMLRNLVSEAIVQELHDRGATESEARAELAQKWMTGYEVAKIAATDIAGAGEHGLPGTIVNIVMELAKEDVKSSFVEQAEEQINDNYSDGSSAEWMFENDAELSRMLRLQALNYAVENGFISEDSLPSDLNDPTSNGEGLPRDPGVWGEGAPANDRLMERLLYALEKGDAPIEDFNGSGVRINPFGDDVESTIEDFQDGYGSHHESLSDLFRAAEEVAEARKENPKD
ncbi:TPR repeat region-containing protein [Nocardiopsis sp. M1B1]|uniref:TPR repeat region-containing protein n=1 Tax=Nocardiopsis sp. M1B1 TaxID=3450454 RepID=UPI00403A7AEB